MTKICCELCGSKVLPLKQFWINYNGDKVSYRHFCRKISNGIRKEVAIVPTRKHPKHYSVLEGNKNKRYNTQIWG